MKRHYRLSLLAALGFAALIGPGFQASAADYRFIKEIPTHDDLRWDYLSVDPEGRRLFVSHQSKVIVIDIDNDSIVGQIADTGGVHGIAIAPELGKCFVSDGGESKVSMVNLKTLKTISKIDTGRNPDAIIYEPGQQEVYAFNGRGNSATVIDAKTGNVVATIELPGKPEFAAADPEANRVFCNLEDKSEIAVIDTKAHKVLTTWPIAPGEEASGMAIDTAHKRLFIGCHNKQMEMIDATSGKVVGSVEIGSGVDANAFDPGTQLAFSSNGDGTTTIAHEDSPDKLTLVQSLKTERGARTMAVDPKTHRIYLATAKFEPAPEPAPGERRQRPKMVPGSFKILVYGN